MPVNRLIVAVIVYTILILALLGIVIFLLVKREKESYTYTPAAQMNENIASNANAINKLQGEIAGLSPTKIEKEISKFYKNGVLTADKLKLGSWSLSPGGYNPENSGLDPLQFCYTQELSPVEWISTNVCSLVPNKEGAAAELWIKGVRTNLDASNSAGFQAGCGDKSSAWPVTSQPNLYDEIQANKSEIGTKASTSTLNTDMGNINQKFTNVNQKFTNMGTNFSTDQLNAKFITLGEPTKGQWTINPEWEALNFCFNSTHDPLDKVPPRFLKSQVQFQDGMINTIFVNERKGGPSGSRATCKPPEII